MKPFDRIIGYEKEKEELLRVADAFKNAERYARLGAALPRGVLLFGMPGTGKTTLARALIEELGIKTIEVRNALGEAKTLQAIDLAFKEASEAEECVVFIDDIDKFSPSSEASVDDRAFSAIQAGIDEVKGKRILIVATANNVCKLPSSLKRNGRFDVRISLDCPTREDARKIVAHYLSQKKVAKDLNLDDLSRMITYTSCADLEKIVNEAANYASYQRRDALENKDVVRAYLRDSYGLHNNEPLDEETKRSVAIHEAGHILMAEVVKEGSVGIACIGKKLASTKLSEELERRPYKVLLSLAGKVACELFDKGRCASGCQYDLDKALSLLEEGLSKSGIAGTSFLSSAEHEFASAPNAWKDRLDGALNAELERYLFLCKEIIMRNKRFLLALSDALFEKGVLLHSDIEAIRKKCEVVEPGLIL